MDWTHPYRPNGSEHGFSLVEILVALFVLGLGVLGAVELQLAAGRTIRQSATHTAAVHLATDIAEHLRLNPAGLGGGSYLGADFRASEDIPAAGQGCHDRNCMPQELAQQDLAEWKRRFASEVPGGRLRICRDAAPWNSATASLQWDCSGEGTAPIMVKIGWPRSRRDGAPQANAGQFPPLVSLMASADGS
ncbi:type IV pilus modification protein PilV [Noviherbaspirillum galbum]|uniref:Type IV pilus modification protein PilV n=1 Tax=Noviherbaspirillum galbum TaxID=2709383 RepID=A0A6B3SHV9_9BURK|nr:type IV pilus modification protein PilV [Noviherbaspirillum galbum]NEX60253.1 type IV pilus modification protein PilV [Noviherbaspirillum galbum]